MLRNFAYSIMIFTLFTTVFQRCGNKQEKSQVVEIGNEYFRFFEELGVPDSPKVMGVVDSLVAKYPYFFPLYTEGVLLVGEVPDSQFPDKLYDFLTYSLYKEVLDTVELHFDSTKELENEVSIGFSGLKSQFPNTSIPNVYWMISVFNEPIVVGDKLVAVSLEQYLGVNHTYYNQLGVYRYLQEYKIPQRIPYDILDGWNRTEFLLDANKDRLLDEMIYEGKLLYLQSVLFPDASAEDLLGYTLSQQTWLKKNEQAVWTYLVEQKQLFTTDQSVKRKYIGEAPYTSFFGENSPSRIGRIIGFRIVEGYMKNNKEITIQSLFNHDDNQAILAGSRYNP